MLNGKLLTSVMASRKITERRLTRKMRYGTRGGRATTNVFSQFGPEQVQEFKEAFNMIDQDRDGIIDEDNLREIFQSFGNDIDRIETKVFEQKISFKTESAVNKFLWRSNNQTVLISGKDPNPEVIEKMLREVSCPINFTLFLAMFGDKLQGIDAEKDIRNAFSCFDDDGSGNNLLVF